MVPIYDYGCYACNATKEERHGINEDPVILCHICQEPMTKVFLQAPLMRMGTGLNGKWTGSSEEELKKFKKK